MYSMGFDQLSNVAAFQLYKSTITARETFQPKNQVYRKQLQII